MKQKTEPQPLTKFEIIDKRYGSPELWMATESISEVLNIDRLKIFERKRNLLHVRARYFLINFSLIYTSYKLEHIAKFLNPAINDHASVSCGRDKIQYNIQNYKEVRSEWIEILKNYKSKLQANENNNDNLVINLIDNNINCILENAR